MALQIVVGGVARNLTEPERFEASLQFSAIPNSVASVNVLPLNGNFNMAQRSIGAPVALTIGAMVAGGSCIARFVSDGTNIPSITGAVALNNLGYDNTQAGLINILNVWTDDGTTVFYNWSQPDSQTPGTPAPVFSVQPTVSGTAQEGQTLTSTTGTASNTSSYSRQWLRAGVAVSGQTGATYALTSADIGSAMSVRVTATGPTGLTGQATSAETAAVISAGGSITVPGAPTGATATAGDGSVSVAFTAPANNGGATITGYRVTLSTGQTATGTASPISVAAPNGTAVTATVAAQNSAGYGAESSASNSVTPVAATSAAMRLTGLNNLTESGDGTAGWNYKATSGAGYTGYGVSTVAIPAGAEGYFEVRQPDSGGVSIAIIGLKTSSASQNYTSFAYSVQPLLPGQGSQRYIQITGASAGAAPNGATVLTALGQRYRVGTRINGANLDAYIEVTSDNGVTFQLVHTWPNIPKVAYYCGLSTGTSANNATNTRSLGAS